MKKRILSVIALALTLLITMSAVVFVAPLKAEAASASDANVLSASELNAIKGTPNNMSATYDSSNQVLEFKITTFSDPHVWFNIAANGATLDMSQYRYVTIIYMLPSSNLHDYPRLQFFWLNTENGLNQTGDYDTDGTVLTKSGQYEALTRTNVMTSGTLAQFRIDPMDWAAFWQAGDVMYIDSIAFFKTQEEANQYAAERKLAKNGCTINWSVNGSIVETDTAVPVGSTPTYNGATPTKDGDAQYSYTFAGWSLDGANVVTPTATGNVTYYAVFTPTINSYTVTWEIDGSIVKVDNVDYGEIPEYGGETPTKTGNAQYSYTFAGWSPEVNSVTGDITYVAQFTETLNKYTITWVVDGVSSTTEVEYGTVPTFNGTPTKEGNAEYGYEFAGWDTEPVAVTGPATYTATFNQVASLYDVQWEVNGEIVETDVDVPYGTTPEFNGTEPTKAADAQYTYTFAGWSPEVSAVTGDVTYVAQFTGTLNKYTITWIVEGVSTTTEVEYGTVPTFNGTPTKTGNEQYSYTFTGWDTTPVAVTGAATYTAVFTQTVNTYKVEWYVNGEIVETDAAVPYGTVPTFDGATPTKEATAQYSYTFAGWSPEVVAVTGNIVYVAEFTATVNSYTITWVVDGVSTTTEVEYGTVPTFNGTPEKAGNAQYTYTFANWDTAPVAVTGPATYTAVFTATINTYTVKWDVDGVIVETDVAVPYGTMPTFDGKTPTRAATAQYTYTFAGWSPEVDVVTGDVTYVAQFDATVNKYTISWVVEGVTTTTEVPYGTVPTFDGTPEKAGNAQYTYTFAGWSPEVTAVVGNAFYIAQFTATVNTYKVEWEVEGTVVETDTDVPYGTLPTFDGATPTKEATAQYTYTFAGWKPTVSTVEGDVKYVAEFTATLNTYTVEWEINGEIVETDADVPYGTTPEYNGAEPTKTATVQYTYTFAGWSPEISEVTGHVVYVAQFDATVNKYNVTWVSEGETIKVDSVPYGELPKYVGFTPTKASDDTYKYVFTGWLTLISPVVGDVTYVAQFTKFAKDDVTYTIEWVVEGTVVETDVVVAGTVPTFDGETPTKAATDMYTYEFSGWTPEVGAADGDIQYVAVFTAVPTENNPGGGDHGGGAGNQGSGNGGTTNPPAEDETDAPETNETATDAPSANAPADNSGADADEEKGGCGSTIGGISAIVIALASVVLFVKKKKED